MEKININQLLVCRNLLQDKTIMLLNDYLCASDDELKRCRLVSALIAQAETLGLSGNILQSYILYRLTHDDNLVAQLTELSCGNIGASLLTAFTNDIAVLKPLLTELPGDLISCPMLNDYKPTFPKSQPEQLAINRLLAGNWSDAEFAEALLSYYLQFGAGDIAAFRAFRWDKGALTGIQHFEPTLFTDLIGYDKQKDQLRANTAAFVHGHSANNVLLVGARGTGKSTSVKALANEFHSQGLRLLQITKPQLTELPEIMMTLRRFASKKFIIFLDDLSFEESDPEYKYLKSAIEGGVEGRPGNVLIYATSNRRHLIKETWQDREQGQNELYRNDSMNETISLSDRFGLIIIYRAPNQDEYLAIIDHYLRRDGVTLTPEELRIAGHRWELEHSGRSGRTAIQFVNHYLGQKHNNQ